MKTKHIIIVIGIIILILVIVNWGKIFPKKKSTTTNTSGMRMGGALPIPPSSFCISYEPTVPCPDRIWVCYQNKKWTWFMNDSSVNPDVCKYGGWYYFDHKTPSTNQCCYVRKKI